MGSGKIGLVSLGCPKNRVDSEIMLGILKNNDYEIVSDPEQADAIIVNTCGFIESAKQEAIDTILEMADFKNRGCRALIVTGCLAQRYSGDILKEMPEVDAVVGTGSYSDISDIVGNLLNKGPDNICDLNKKTLCGPLDNIEYLNKERVISTPSAYAYLKIAEGCDNCCTYCIIPSLRGKFRSRTKEDILAEAKKIAEAGVKEIILVAQDTTGYGRDLYGKTSLADLLRGICSINGDFRVRLLYCYPHDLNDELIKVISENDKICKYIDLPIQHASNKILKAMGRRDTAGEISSLLKKLRENIPGVVIRTSLISGFPGENDEDHELLKTFIKENRFDRLGVFTYSKEEGTPAARMKEQVPARMKKKRMNDIMAIQKEITKESNIHRLNKVYETHVDGISDDGIFYYGRTYAEAPDIDGIVYFTSAAPVQIGDTVKVKMLNYEDYDMIGEQVF